MASFCVCEVTVNSPCCCLHVHGLYVLDGNRDLQTQRNTLSRQQQQLERDRALLALQQSTAANGGGSSPVRRGSDRGGNGVTGVPESVAGSGDGDGSGKGGSKPSEDKDVILQLRQRILELEDDSEVEGRQLKAVFMLRELALGTYVRRVRGALSRWQTNIRAESREQGCQWR